MLVPERQSGASKATGYSPSSSFRMVLDDCLPKALANRDVIEPLERETRVHTGASLSHRPDDMRRSVRVPQRSGNRNSTLPVHRPSSCDWFELLEREACVTGRGLSLCDGKATPMVLMWV